MIIAFVGMPGSGKSEATKIVQEQGFLKIRFGDITDEEIQRRNLPLNEVNERMIREQLRKDHGMEAYAKMVVPKIKKVQADDVKDIVLDGLYSLEEYVYLKKYFPDIVVVAVFASPSTRKERLSKRDIRPLTPEETESRDFSQLENLHTGGPIALADFTVINESGMEELGDEVKKIMFQIK